MKILLHICCAPCACYPIKFLKERGYEVFGLWFNPNIHPYLEYKKRLEALKELEKIENIRVIYLDKYELERFLREVAYREEKPLRCRICYSMRLETAASVAKHGKFSGFTSTLLYSKFQNRDLILDAGRNAGRKFGVKFLEFDFREGWKEGIEISKQLNLYRQQYCGCIYSEKERYCKE